MPPSSGHGDHAVGLDVDVLLVADPVLALDNLVGEPEAGLDVALVDGDRLEDLGRVQRVEDRLGRLVVDVDVGRDQALPILVREQQDRLRDVPDHVLGQARLIVDDERDDVAAGDVAVIDDGEARRVEQRVDGADAAAGDRRPDRPPVQHAREDEVVDVLRRPGDLVDPVAARDVAANGGHRQALGSGLPTAHLGKSLPAVIHGVNGARFRNCPRPGVPTYRPPETTTSPRASTSSMAPRSVRPSYGL